MARSRASGFGWVTGAYVVALIGAAITMELASGSELIRLALADAVATVIVFAFSVVKDNSSFYDPYWSVAPIAIAGWLAAQPSAAPVGRRVLVVALIALWGVRLTWNWARGWTGLDHEDWRYVDLRRKHGKLYWPVSFAGIHFFPTVLVFLGCVPMISALGAGATPLGWLDGVAAAITLGATALEAIADEQLRAFRSKKKSAGEICDRGLWSWSRHPNYLGEIGIWVGMAMFGVAAGAPWWSGAGAVAMIALFLGISIPMIERRSEERRPGWGEYVKRTSRLMLWPPRR